MIRKPKKEYEQAELNMNLDKCDYPVLATSDCNKLPLENGESKLSNIFELYLTNRRWLP